MAIPGVSSTLGKKIGKAVIGHFPEYIELGNKLDIKTFNISTDVWEKMTETERWAANQKFLDDIIENGDEVILATPLSEVIEGSYLQKEINYLIDNGYEYFEEAQRLIKQVE